LWEGGPGAWTRLPIAQLRHDTAAGTWTLFWAVRNRRWHRYDHLDPTPQLDDLLKEIDQDPLFMFWGSPALSQAEQSSPPPAGNVHNLGVTRQAKPS
jgi:hypothetical protein